MDTTGRTVTTGQIFSKLFQSSTRSAPVRYFFGPGQNFVVQSLTREDLVATITSSLLNDAPTDNKRTKWISGVRS